MNWLKTHRQTAWIVGLTLLLPVGLYVYALGNLLAVRSGIQVEIDRLVPRVARMQGLRDAQADMEAALADGGRENAAMVYPSSQDEAAVSAALQAEGRRLLGDAGMSISNSQVLPAQELASFDRIGINVTATGDVAALDAALESLALYRPMLLVESLDVYPNRSRSRSEEAPQTVTARFQIISLRSAT